MILIIILYILGVALNFLVPMSLIGLYVWRDYCIKIDWLRWCNIVLCIVCPFYMAFLYTTAYLIGKSIQPN